MKKRGLVILTLVGLGLGLSVSTALADKVYLKDGKVYEGKLIGKSPWRYLFNVSAAGETAQMSFFVEDVDKIELSKDTVESQIPYLKDVESLDVKVAHPEVRQDSQQYRLALYTKSQDMPAAEVFTDTELKKVLNDQEYEYYQKFTDILKRYADKFSTIQNIFLNLTTASKEDFGACKQYMDEMYFEMNSLYIPQLFKKSHTLALESAKSTYLAFNSLEQGQLEEASKQIKTSEDSRERAAQEFRAAIESRKPKVSETAPQAQPQPQAPAAKPATP